MRLRRELIATRVLGLAVSVGVALFTLAPAQANWLTSLTKGTSKVGKATHLHPDLGDLGKAIGHLPKLEPGSGSLALAAHVTPEGHWKFATHEGKVFTVGTPDEMQHMLPSLAPGATPDTKLMLFISEESIFANPGALDKLPSGSQLHISTKHGAYALNRAADGALSLQLKPNVRIVLGTRRAFDEAVGFFARPLNKSNIRTLSIDPSATKSLSSAPRLDPTSKAPLVDSVAPENLTSSFGALRGQTAIVVGRVENGKITFQPASGGEVSRNLDELVNAARDADVNLVLLNSASPLQPGGRNWLWQSIEVGGFNEAISKATFGDFLDVLGSRRTALNVSSELEGGGRIRLLVKENPAVGVVDSAQSTLSDVMGRVTGEVISQSMNIYARDENRQRELDARIIPGVPSVIQISYLVGVVFGLLSWATTRAWWRRVWQPRVRQPDESWIIDRLKRLPNFLAYLLIFLPIVGVPAFIWQLAMQAWIIVTTPFRWLGRLLRRRVEV